MNRTLAEVEGSTVEEETVEEILVEARKDTDVEWTLWCMWIMDLITMVGGELILFIKTLTNGMRMEYHPSYKYSFRQLNIMRREDRDRLKRQRSKWGARNRGGRGSSIQSCQTSQLESLRRQVEIQQLQREIGSHVPPVIENRSRTDNSRSGIRQM